MHVLLVGRFGPRLTKERWPKTQTRKRKDDGGELSRKGLSWVWKKRGIILFKIRFSMDSKFKWFSIPSSFFIPPNVHTNSQAYR